MAGNLHYYSQPFDSSMEISFTLSRNTSVVLDGIQYEAGTYHVISHI